MNNQSAEITHTDRQRKVAAIGALAELYSRELSSPGLRMYLLALEDVPVGAVEQAAARAAKSSRFMPTPVELRELAGVASPDDRAVLAFASLEAAVVKYGGYKSVEFDDPIITAAVNFCGGWIQVCSKPDAEFSVWFRKDFCAAYASLCRTGVTGDVTRPLIGIAERHNATLGLGDRPQDRIVIRTGLPWAGEIPRRIDAQQRPADVPKLMLRTA